MPRPKASPEQQVRAYQLHMGGLKPKAIRIILEQEFDSPVSIRTVERWGQDFNRHSEEMRRLDSPFQWHGMAEHDLPWEAGAYLLHLCAEIQRSLGAAAPLGGWPPLTVRQACWCWRVHLAAPDLETSRLFWVVQEFVWRELAHHVLGVPLDLSDLEAYLAYRPWESNDGKRAYWKAAHEGRIPRVPPIKQTVAEWSRVPLGLGQDVFVHNPSLLPGIGDDLLMEAWNAVRPGSWPSVRTAEVAPLQESL